MANQPTIVPNPQPVLDQPTVPSGQISPALGLILLGGLWLGLIFVTARFILQYPAIERSQPLNPIQYDRAVIDRLHDRLESSHVK